MNIFFLILAFLLGLFIQVRESISSTIHRTPTSSGQGKGDKIHKANSGAWPWEDSMDREVSLKEPRH